MQSDNRAPSVGNSRKTCWFLAAWEPLPLAPAWCLGWGSARRLFPLSRNGDAIICTRQDAERWPLYLSAAGLECHMVLLLLIIISKWEKWQLFWSPSSETRIKIIEAFKLFRLLSFVFKNYLELLRAWLEFALRELNTLGKHNFLASPCHFWEIPPQISRLESVLWGKPEGNWGPRTWSESAQGVSCFLSNE